MVYINVNEDSEWTLNINNNVREPFPTPDELTYTFTHILSNRVSTYVMGINPPAGSPFLTTAFGVSNARYTEFWWNQTEIPSTLLYDGEYNVVVRNSSNVLLYTAIWKVTGQSEIEENPFIQYESDNEGNDSYVYIEEN